MAEHIPLPSYNVSLHNQSDLEEFASCIRDAVCDAFGERFNRDRLRETPMRYNDFQHNRGQAFADGHIEVKQSESALQLAGTVVHELAHILVGVHHWHDSKWHDGAGALGLLEVQASGQDYKPEHFRSDLLKAITDALARLYKERPSLVYPVGTVIPLPDYIGMPDCLDPHDDCDFGHKIHVMQFQLDGVRWMLANPKNILYADEPGLGKTVGTMMYINATHPKNILIICPNNVKLIWRDHFRFWCTHPDILEDMEVASTALWTFSPVTIMNYEAARRWKASLKKMQWDLVVFDEMHYIKNPAAERSKACYSISGEKLFGLTGTPIVNYIEEAFPLIHYLDRDNWPEFNRFASSYMSYGNRFGKNLARFNERLRATIMVRRFKKDVLTELPKKRRQVVQFEVDVETAKLIEEEHKLWNEMQGKNSNVEQVKMLNAMRNDSDTALDDVDWAALIEELRYTKRYAFERMAAIAHQIGLAKVPLAIEFIKDALENKEKVVVFGHHRDVLGRIHDAFKPNSVLLLGGSGNQAEATSVAATSFSTNPDVNVFVGGITLAAGYSLAGSSTIVFVEEDWVPGVMTQAEDRAHGIARGEKDATSLMIHHLVFENSLDTYKAKLTIRKQKSIDRATGKL